MSNHFITCYSTLNDSLEEYSRSAQSDELMVSSSRVLTTSAIKKKTNNSILKSYIAVHPNGILKQYHLCHFHITQLSHQTKHDGSAGSAEAAQEVLQLVAAAAL